MAVSLRTFFQRQFDDLLRLLDERHQANQTAMSAALSSAKEAVTKAEGAVDERLKLLNELRSGVATTAELEALEKRVMELERRAERAESSDAGGASQITDRRQLVAASRQTLSLWIGVAAVVASLLVALVTHI
jgi:hypothetical protein